MTASHHAQVSILYPTAEQHKLPLKCVKVILFTAEKAEIGLNINKCPRFEKYERWQAHPKQQQYNYARQKRRSMHGVKTWQTQVSR
jgi:hypothetical protein